MTNDPLTMMMSLTLPTVAAAEVATRTIRGIIAPWGEWGNTNAGRKKLLPGSLRFHPDSTRIKLVDEHQHPPRPIGFMSELGPDTPAGLHAAFKVATTPGGDRALVEASEGVRDAFSVELWDVTENAHGEISDALVGRVALVTTPAFSSALVAEVAASQSPGTTPGPNGRITPAMTAEQITRLSELLALETRTPEEQTETDALVAMLTPPPAPEAAPEAPAAVAASVPAGIHRPPATTTTRPIADFFAAQARIHAGESRPEVEAALSNVTNTANLWTSPDAYAGELWSGVVGNRRYVEMMTPGTLTSYKGTGWRWVVHPAVADYAGDKAAVPSNLPTTEAAPYTAARLAGAHDLDRKFWDFGDSEFIASYYAGLTNSYAAQSNLKARAFLAAAALANPITGPVGADILALALRCKLELETEDDATGLSYGSPDWYMVNPTDYAGLLDTSASEVSAFIDLLGVSPDQFTPTAAVAAGVVAAGVKPAATFYELPGSPIRVETVNLANGGVDGGVFGYYATLLNAAKGVVSATATAGP